MRPQLRTEPAVPDEEPAMAASSFEEFFRSEHPRLYRSLCMVTGSRHESEEICQEAFLRLWERWDRVATLEDPAGYLHRTAMNAFRSRYRTAVRAMRRTVRPSPDDDAYRVVEDRDAVMRALRELIPQQRAAVVLTSLLGYSSEEAGRMLGMQAGTVRTLTARARAAMRQTVGEQP